MTPIINIIQKEQSEQTMTSLEIAELTGKQHKNLMQAIRNMEPAWEKVHGLKFQLMFREVKIGNGAKLVLRWEQLEMEEGFATPHSALQRSMKRKSAQLLKSTIERFSCWGTRTRTRKGRTRICSVTITPYPNFG